MTFLVLKTGKKVIVRRDWQSRCQHKNPSFKLIQNLQKFVFKYYDLSPPSTTFIIAQITKNSLEHNAC